MSNCSVNKVITTITLLVPMLFWATQARPSCMISNPETLFNSADMVFAAELDFTEIKFIKTEHGSGYYKYPFFDYRSVYVWKGQPDERGTIFLGYSDSVMIYEQPGLLDSDRKYAEDLAVRPRELRLYYAYETEHGLRYGGCEDAPLFEYAFTYRLHLGNPVINHRDQASPQLTAKEIFDFFDSMDRVFNDEVRMHEYYVYVNDGVQALLLLDQQQAMLDYLLRGPFSDCPMNKAVIFVASALIAELPEDADQLFDRFFPLLSCGDPDTRYVLYAALINIASETDLHVLIDTVLLDPSVILMSRVSGSLRGEDSKAFKSILDRNITMLQSKDPDERMFAAKFLSSQYNLLRSDLEILRKLCSASYAQWEYPEYNHTESTNKICQNELRYYNDKSDLTLEQKLLFDTYYVDPGY